MLAILALGGEEESRGWQGKPGLCSKTLSQQIHSQVEGEDE